MLTTTDAHSHGLDTPVQTVCFGRKTLVQWLEIPTPKHTVWTPLSRPCGGTRVVGQKHPSPGVSTDAHSHGLDTTVQTVCFGRVLPVQWRKVPTSNHAVWTPLSRPCELCSVLDPITRVNTRTMASTTDAHSHGLDTPVQTVYFGRVLPVQWCPPPTPTHTVWTPLSRPCTLDAKHPRQWRKYRAQLTRSGRPCPDRVVWQRIRVTWSVLTM